MNLSSWMTCFKTRLNSQRRLRRRRHAEQLEDRTLLSVTGVRVGTDLSVFVDEGNDITVQNDPATGNVQVIANGSVVSRVRSAESREIKDVMEVSCP